MPAPNQTMAASQTPLVRLFPETQAGGFTRRDGTVEFYTRVNALLDPAMIVLDFGAGRGASFDKAKPDYRTALQLLQGKVTKVIGVDVDPVVLANPSLDQAFQIGLDCKLPLDDHCLDLVVSDWVLEHIEFPHLFAKEVTRVLKPGGWFCARTPNRWHYDYLVARMVPPQLEARLLGVVQPSRKTKDIFPKFYLMNDRRSVARYFNRTHYVDYSYYYSPEPAYLPKVSLLWRFVLGAENVAPETMKANLFIFIQKRAGDSE